MELSQYLRITLRRWPVALLALVVTSAITAVYVVEQPSVFESKGSYVIRPRTVDTGQGLRAMDTLVRGVEINSTYATIARSRRIRDRAQARLGETPVSGLNVSSEAITGTNVLEIAVSGQDPQAAHDLAVAVGEETVAYVRELQDLYELAPLDAPRVSNRPVSPNRPLLVATGVLFGLALGVLLAFATEGVVGRRSMAPPEPLRAPFGPSRSGGSPNEDVGRLREPDAV